MANLGKAASARVKALVELSPSGKDDQSNADEIEAIVAEALQHEGKASEGLVEDVRYLSSLYKGYKSAYDILHVEVGNFRAYSAPYVRPDAEAAGLEDKPGIFLITLPKSATVYIAQSIAQTLGYRLSNTLVTPTFPKNIVWTPMILDFMRGGMVSVSHMQPDDNNLNSIKNVGLRKAVLHIRDPRPALLSWVHFVQKNRGRGNTGTGSFINPAGVRFTELDFATRVDGCIKNFFMHCVSWIETWTKQIENTPEIDFLIVRHEHLVANEEEYFARIMDFYGLDTRVSTVEQSAATHFRNGDNNEWRTALTQAQIDRMNNAIPDWMWEKFGWEK